MGGYPVLIGGTNRSGTSLVRRLVGSHPEIAVPPLEFEYFKRLAISGRELSPSQVHGFVDEILSLPKVAAWELDRRAVLRYALADPSARGLFVAALRTYADALRKPRFGEKTTGNERHLRTFDRWFGNDYTFVHVLRHPLPTFASDRWYGGAERALDPHVWAREWVRSSLIALKAGRARRDRYVVVRYEDLVRAPEAELWRICERAQVAYDERMLTMGDFAEKENSSFEHASASYKGLIRTSDAIDRLSRIPDADLALLKRICRRSAALMGYEVDDPESVEPLRHAWKPAELRLRLSYTGRRAVRLAVRPSERSSTVAPQVPSADAAW